MYENDSYSPCQYYFFNVFFFFIYGCRKNYQQYLRRPDLKQEPVSQWQKDFNRMPDDMREDEETKAELHLRLDVMTNLILQLS